LPVGVEYKKPITIFNPFDEPLIIKDIFTSEKFLIIEFTDNAKNMGLKKFFEIPAHQTKTIANLQFNAGIFGKYQGFVHINTEKTNVIIHVEIFVSKSGVHSILGFFKN
jgi:hypothetical protein